MRSVGGPHPSTRLFPPISLATYGGVPAKLVGDLEYREFGETSSVSRANDHSAGRHKLACGIDRHPCIAGVPEEHPLPVGDTWTEAHPDKDRIFTWQLAIAMRPKLFVFTSVGNLSHDSEGNGGFEGRMTIAYHFSQPGEGVTLFTRTMTIEAYKDAPLPPTG